MEFSDRDTLCPSPNFTVKTNSSTSSRLSGFKNRLSNIFHSSSAPTSPTEDKKFRMSILTSRSTKSAINTRRLRKNAARNKASPSSPRSGKSATSLLNKISFKHITIRATRARRFSTFHHKPSTLDFRCAGDETSSIMILERVNSVNMNRMIFGAVQKRRRGDLTYLFTDCPPTIAWVSPDIAGWDFSEIGITINCN